MGKAICILNEIRKQNNINLNNLIIQNIQNISRIHFSKIFYLYNLNNKYIFEYRPNQYRLAKFCLNSHFYIFYKKSIGQAHIEHILCLFLLHQIASRGPKYGYALSDNINIHLKHFLEIFTNLIYRKDIWSRWDKNGTI